jgi:hypothetical protein
MEEIGVIPVAAGDARDVLERNTASTEDDDEQRTPL